MLISPRFVRSNFNLQKNVCSILSHNKKYLVVFLIPLLIILTSCDSDTINSPSPFVEIDDNSYNIAYEDSVIFNSNRVLGYTNIQIGSINGTGIRNLCDSLVSFDGSWSPNKRKIIFIGSSITSSYTDWGIYQINLKDYKLTRLLPNETSVSNVAYAPNNNLIAYTIYIPSQVGYKIKVYNVNTGAVIDASDWINYNINTLSWSPDSRKILIDDGFVLDIYTKTITSLFSFQNSQIFLPTWSPDGNKISFSAINGIWNNIYIHDLTTNETKLLYEQPYFQYTSSWSKDGQQIIFDQRGPGNANDYLCKINIDGTNFTQITDASAKDWNPCWFK